MKSSTLFGIKVTIGSSLLLYLITVLSYVIFVAVGHGDIVHNELFMGVYTIALSFITTYVTGNMLLKNTKLPLEEGAVYCDQGLRVYVGIQGLLFFLSLLSTPNQSPIFIAFSALSVIAGSLAFVVMRNKLVT